MVRRDYLLAEMDKLTQILARLLGLKAAGKYAEFEQQFNNVLQDEYNLELEKLLNLNPDEFTDELSSATYSRDKLNALGQMLYVFAEPFEADNETSLILKKVLIIFDLLEEKHRFQTFENIDKRNTIYKHFKKLND